MAAATTYNKVSTSHIPNDIAFSILYKLPLKSLKRFACVQKSWSLLFQNSHFMDMFRTNFTSKHDDDDDTCLLLKESIMRVGVEERDTLYTLSTDMFEDRVRLDWPPPFQEDDSYIDILGSSSVNGIICIYQAVGIDVTTILWNPATGEFKIVPPSLQPYENIEFNLPPDAFGYDKVRDDYKVIRNARYPDDYEGNWFCVPDKDSWYWDGDRADDSYWTELILGMYDPFWEIYSLKSNSWRKFDVADMPVPWPCTSQLNLNGLCHWLGFEPKMWSFDFTNEKFFGTTLPSYLDGIHHTWVKRNLLMLNGCVAFMCNYVDMNSFHIWILGELGVMESWTKLFVFGPLTCVRLSIGAGKKNDMFFTKDHDELGRFNLSTQKFEVVAVNIQQVLIYKEVLLPIEGMSN